MQPTDLGFGRLFDAIRDAVVVADDTGRIVLWNAGAVAMFGYTPTEAAELNVDVLVPDRLRDRHHAGIERYCDTGHGPLIDNHVPVELPALRKDGEEIIIELTLSPIEANGRRFALAVLRDVTERATLHRDLRRRNAEVTRANEALRDANESLNAFTYVVSHDLKEPVRAMEAYLRALIEDHSRDLDPEAVDLVTRAYTANERLSSLLRGLLDYSRVTRADVSPEPLNVAEVLESESCQASYEHLLEAKGAVLEVVAGIPPVHATYSMLCQVLANFITNALKHNRNAVPRIRVSGRLHTEECVEVSIEDNGPGFPREMVERFKHGLPDTLSPSAQGGFGLIIASRAIERLGGELRLARSADLGGAAVRFTLPLGTIDPHAS